MKYKLTGELFEGKRFFSLTVISWDGSLQKWKCKCDCGKEVYKRTYELKRIKRSPCECAHLKYFEEKYLPWVGKTKFRMKFTSYEYVPGKGPILNFICECGNKKSIMTYKLNRTKSCGCLLQENRTKPKLENDITNKQFGDLKALQWSKQKQKWLCKCICGNKHYVKLANLVNGDTKSCGCLRLSRAMDHGKEFINKKHGYFKCFGYYHDTKRCKIILRCKCKCGKIYEMEKSKWGKYKSCGCLKKELRGQSISNAALSNKQVVLARNLYKSKCGFNLTVLSNMFGVCLTTISKIVKEKTYKNIE